MTAAVPVPARPRLLTLADRLHAWHGTAGPLAAAGLRHPALSPEERARATRFLRPEEAGWYAHSHAELRRLLARYLATAPARLRFGRAPCPRCGDGPGGAHGRPRVTEPATALSFSLSRCGPDWLLAVAADGRRVGADVERLRPLPAARLAAACLTDAERAWVTGPGAPDQHGRSRRFLRCWTRKEAVVKAAGVGLATDLARIETHAARPGPAVVALPGPGGGRFAVTDLALAPGLVASVAVESPGGAREGDEGSESGEGDGQWGPGAQRGRPRRKDDPGGIHP